MQVLSFGYDVSRVLDSLCTKFVKNPRKKTSLVNILLSDSVLTGHIRFLAGHVRTRPNISGPRAGHIRSFRTILLVLMSTIHGFFVGFSHLVPSILLVISPSSLASF
jgi:hypothetical protein